MILFGLLMYKTYITYKYSEDDTLDSSVLSDSVSCPDSWWTQEKT